MRKACIWSGGATLTLFLGYTTVATAAKDSPWYLDVLWIGFVISGALFLLTGLAYLFLQGRRHLNPLDILDDWRCTYWPLEKQLQVTLWFGDYSNSSGFKLSCIAQFDEQIVNVDDKKEIGGTYVNLGNTSFKPSRSRPIMVEFLKHNVDIINARQAIIMVSIKPPGMWATKKRNKEVTVQVINR